MCAMAACADGRPGAFEDGALHADIREAPLLPRGSVAMLSVPVAYVACPIEPPGRYAFVCGEATPVLGNEWARLGGRIRSALGSGSDPDAMHSAALLDLLTGAAGNTLDRSISYLEMTTRIAPSADRFVDLSGGYLSRAGRDRDARSLIAALDAAARAAQIDSSNVPSRFNMALALRELGLFQSARAEFEEFARQDPHSPWADEALRYAAALAIDTVVAPSDATISPDSIAAFARRHSNEARLFSWERLAAWARAFQAGDAAESERHLRLAEAAGAAISQQHLDHSIEDAARAVREAGVKTRLLAAAHLDLSRGQQLARMGQSAAADTAFRHARAVGALSPALAGWVSFHEANNQLALKDPRQAERMLRQILGSPAAIRYPALAARCRWTLSVILLRTRRDAEGAREAEKSRDLYAALGEPEYHAQTIGLLGEAAHNGGDSRSAYAYLTEALQMFREYPLSGWRHNTMLVMSRAAVADGFTAAAELIDAEDEAASMAAHRTYALVESQLTRARNARALGDSAMALAALHEGASLATALPEGNIRAQLQTEISVERTELDGVDQANARAVLDTAVAYFNSIENYAKQLRAYAARAALAIRMGDRRLADADLDEALSVYEQRRNGAMDATQQSLLTQQARHIADALTMSRLSVGDAAGALDARERSRESRLRLHTRHDPTAIIVELAIIGDTLVAFTRRGDSVAAATTPGVGASLRSDIELLDVALERGAPQAAWEPLLESLYSRLIAPIAAGFRPTDSVLTVIAEGSLSRVPFAALRNPRDGSYLVDHYAIRYASSLRQADLPRTPIPVMARALLVADPLLDRRAYPALAPLRGAGREVDSIASLLPRSRVLRGAGVDTTRLKLALADAQVFHFAGHAIFDDARPQRSQLAMSSRGLTAAAIAKMHLPALRLVVLSACETNRAATGAGAGFLGLAESFVSAGAGGVIGSLWKVNDQLTMQLMQEFYSALGRTRDPVIALRDAQRSMREVSPGAWAAFRYAGR
jgi:tetratricopeptide (TPR) repeat protein